MEDDYLNKLRALSSGKHHQLNDLIEQVKREGIEPFIVNVEQCKSNLLKAETDLKAVCLLLCIPIEGDVAASSGEQPKPKKSGDRGNIKSEQVLEAVTATLSAESHKNFNFKELMVKTELSRAQIAKAAKELVKQGKATETTDTSSKAPGLKPKLYTWKG